MPRNKKQSLENIEPRANRESLLNAALMDRPLVERSYGDRDGLWRLRLKLEAIRLWAWRLKSASPTQLLVAGSLRPNLIAQFFDQVAQDCHTVAPPRPGRSAQRTAREWSSPQPPPQDDSAVVAALRAIVTIDRLIYRIGLLGECVVGSFTWVPAIAGPDGTEGEDVRWELEYSPVAPEVEEIVNERELLEGNSGARYRAEDSCSENLAVIRLHAANAVDAVSVAVQGTVAGLSFPTIRLMLGDQHESALRVHEAFLTSIKDAGATAREETATASGAWRHLHANVTAHFRDWLVTVVPALGIERHQRQRLKRDMKTLVGYVAQYASLLRANAASLELSKAVHIMTALCSRLGNAIEKTMPSEYRCDITDELQATVCLACSRAMVSDEDERAWRQRLGEHAGAAGRLIAQLTSGDGQTKACKHSDVARVANLVWEQSESRGGAARLDVLLDAMQEVGLAVRVPAKFLVRKKKRSGERRQEHVGRVWWFNPLGEILAIPDAQESGTPRG